MSDWLSRSDKIALFALGASIANAVASWSTWSATGERMDIEVRRDLKAPIERIRFMGGAADGIRSDGSLMTTWNVYIINTSRTTTIPLTDFAISDWQFNGDAAILVNDNIPPQPALTIVDAKDGTPLSLPVSVSPGSVRRLQVHAGFNISIKAFPTAFPKGVPEIREGTFYPLGGDNGLDPFGNAGSAEYPGILETTDRKPRAPCLAIAFRTGSGAVFHGQGHYYPEEIVRNHIYPQRACHDAQIGRPWESVAPVITRLLMRPALFLWMSIMLLTLSGVLLLVPAILAIRRRRTTRPR